MGKRKHNRNKKKSTVLTTHPHSPQQPQSHNHSESHHQHYPSKKGNHHGRQFMGSHPVSTAADAANPHQNAGTRSASAHQHTRPAPKNADTGSVAREQTNAIRERDGCAACHAASLWRERLASALRGWMREMRALVEDMPLGGARDDGGMDWRPENTVWICYVDRVEDVGPVLGQGAGAGLDGKSLYSDQSVEPRLRWDAERDVVKGFVTPPCTPENARLARV